MQVIGFLAEFTSVVQLLFAGARAKVGVNLGYTQYFSICQGVRQGCPLAPYLFLITGEVLN
jgi:hypothetical protein